MEIGKPFNPYKLFVGSFIPNCLMKYKHLSASAKLLWARLAQFAGEDGVCYPSQKTLAEEVGISEMQVNRLLKELEEKGFILRQRPTGRARYEHQTTKYFFLFHECFESQIRDSNTNIGVSSNTNVNVSSYTNGYVRQRESYIKENQLRELNIFNNTPNLQNSAYPLKASSFSSKGKKEKQSNQTCTGKEWQASNQCIASTNSSLLASKEKEEKPFSQCQASNQSFPIDQCYAGSGQGYPVNQNRAFSDPFKEKGDSSLDVEKEEEKRECFAAPASARPAQACPAKRQFLDHVFLTEQQYNELVSRFGEEGAGDYIERLNNYIHQIGRKKAEARYKSHYHVILNWYNMEQKELERRIAVREAIKQKEEDKYL